MKKLKKPSRLDIQTFRNVFEEEIDRNGNSYPEINKSCKYWLNLLTWCDDFQCKPIKRKTK